MSTGRSREQSYLVSRTRGNRVMEDPDPDPHRSFLVSPAPTPNPPRSASSLAPPPHQSQDPQPPSPDLPTNGSLPEAHEAATVIEAAKGLVHGGQESPAQVPQSPPAQGLPQPASPTLIDQDLQERASWAQLPDLAKDLKSFKELRAGLELSEGRPILNPPMSDPPEISSEK